MCDEVEKREQSQTGEVITTYGTCRFCGQMISIKSLTEWGQKEHDEAASESCFCIEARLYIRTKRQKERVHKQIDKLFGAKNETDNNPIAVPDEVISLLHEVVSPVCENLIASITVDAGNGIKAKISKTQKGNIKVMRTKTDASTYEA